MPLLLVDYHAEGEDFDEFCKRLHATLVSFGSGGATRAQLESDFLHTWKAPLSAWATKFGYDCWFEMLRQMPEEVRITQNGETGVDWLSAVSKPETDHNRALIDRTNQHQKEMQMRYVMRLHSDGNNAFPRAATPFPLRDIKIPPQMEKDARHDVDACVSAQQMDNKSGIDKCIDSQQNSPQTHAIRNIHTNRTSRTTASPIRYETPSPEPELSKTICDTASQSPIRDAPSPQSANLCIRGASSSPPASPPSSTPQAPLDLNLIEMMGKKFASLTI